MMYIVAFCSILAAAKGAECEAVASEYELSLLQTDLRIEKSRPAAHAEVLKASATARSLAWAKAKLGESSFSIWVVVIAALVVVGAVMIAISVGGSSEDAEKKGASPLRPQGMGGSSINTRGSPMASNTPGASRLPTQQSINFQRTPAASSAALPPVGAMIQEDVGGTNDSFDLPPICPSLILPHTEARFMIQMADLRRTSLGSMDILGTSGRKLLHTTLCDSPDGRRCLMLASCGCEDDPRVCVFTPQHGAASQAIEVFGKGGKFYGWLEFPSRSQALLSFTGAGGDQKPVLQIEIGSQQDLRMSASAMDGRLLASGGRNVGVAGKHFDGVDSWKMQVKPGVDAVLVTSCMLALILLRPWPGDERFSMGASTAGGTQTSLRPLR